MEGLGKRLQDARIAKSLTLDEAARLTKIRPSRLSEIEAEDFSNFASLAYAKGFLQIYGKFLDVDVSSYLEAFESSEGVTVDGYSYLQDNPAPKPARARTVRKTESRGSIWPLVVGVIVLVVGFSLLKLILDIRRIKPKAEPTIVGVPATSTAPPSVPSVGPAAIAAPRALPVESPSAGAVVASTPLPTVPTTNQQIARAAPSATATVPEIATAAPSEPEVRRAQPVRPEELASDATTVRAGINRVDIRPLKKTYVKVVLDNDDENPAFEQWISPSDGTRQFRGEHVSIRVLDREAVEVRKNGRPVTRGDADVTIE